MNSNIHAEAQFDFEANINTLKYINSNKSKYINAVNGKINVVNKELASKVEEIDKFIQVELEKLKKSPNEKQNYQLIKEIKKFFESLILEQSKVVNQYKGIWTRAISFLSSPETTKIQEATLLYQNLQKTYQTIISMNAELEAAVAKTDKIEQRKKEVDLEKLKLEQVKNDQEQRKKTLQLTLESVRMRSDVFNFPLSNLPRDPLPKRLFNFALGEVAKNKEVQDLDTRYHGGYVLYRSAMYAQYAVSLLNQVLFDKDYSAGIFSQNDINGLMRLCQNRNNFLYYAHLLEKIYNKAGPVQEESIKELTDEIAKNVDLLSSPESDKVTHFSLKDKKTSAFIFPGGWKGYRAHYISYEFRKEGENYYFILHNRGLHTNEFPSLHGAFSFKDEESGKTYSKTTVRIKTTKEALQDKQFINKLISCYVDPKSSSIQVYDDIYTHFIQSGKGTIEKSSTELQLEKIQTQINEINAKITAFNALPTNDANYNKLRNEALQGVAKRELLYKQALKLVNQDSCFQSQQLYGTCHESNYVTAEEDMTSPYLRKCLETFTLANMVNNIGIATLKGKYADEMHFINLLKTHTGSSLEANKKIVASQQKQARLELPLDEDLYIRTHPELREKKPLTKEEKAPFLKGIREGVIQLKKLPKHLKGDKEIVVEALSKDGLALQFASEELKNNIEVVKAAINQNALALQYASKAVQDNILKLLEDKKTLLEMVNLNGLLLKHTKNNALLNDKDVVTAAVTNNGLALQYVSLTMKNNVDIVLAAIKQNRAALAYASPDIQNAIKTNPVLQNNEHYVLACVEKNYFNFQYASDQLTNNPEFVLKALEKDQRAFYYISVSLKNNEPFLIRLVSKYPQLLKNLSASAKDNVNIVMSAVKSDGQVITEASKTLKRNRDFILNALNYYPLAFYLNPLLFDEFVKDETIVLKAVKFKGQVLADLPAKLQNNEKIVLAAVKENGLALEYASDLLKGNLDIVKAAIKQNLNAIRFASPDFLINVLKNHPELKKNKLFMLAMVTYDGKNLAEASEFLKNDEDIVQAAIAKDGLNLQYASEYLKAKKEIVLAAVKQNGEALKSASLDLRKDRDICSMACKQNPLALAYTNSNEIKKDKAIVLSAVQCNGFMLEFASDDLKMDSEVVLKAVNTHGRSLMYADTTLKKNRGVVLAAIKNDPRALIHASPELKKDKELIAEAVKGLKDRPQLNDDKRLFLLIMNDYPEMISTASKHLRSDKEIGLNVVRKNGNLHWYLMDSLKNDLDITTAAVRQSPECMGFIPEVMRKEILKSNPDLQNNKDFAKEIIRFSATLCEFLSDDLKNDHEIVMQAVKYTGMALKFASKRLKADPEIVIEAIKNHSAAFVFASEELQKDEDFVKQAVKVNGMVLQFVVARLQSKKDIVLTAVRNYGLALKYASTMLRNDKEVALAAIKEYSGAYLYISDYLRNDKRFVLEALDINPSIFDDLSDQQKEDKDIALKLVKFNGHYLKQLPHKLQNDPDIVMTAIQTYPLALKYASELLRKDPKIVKKAAKSDNEALIFSPLASDKSFMLELIQEDPMTYLYVDDKLKEDVDIKAAWEK